MKQFLLNIENKYPFITSILISIGIIMWFRGLIGLIDIILVKEKNKLLSYFSLMILALIIFYITNVGTEVIFDIKQRRKISSVISKDNELIEEDQDTLINKINNNHIHTTAALYPIIHTSF